MPSATQAPRTLWQEGRHPGRLVVRAAAFATLVAVLLDLLVTDRLGVVFDLLFVAICVGAALWVRPRDFFTVGVLPPLLLALTVTGLALVDRAAVARAEDSMVQAVVSGLAHHAVALVVAYGLTLAVLGLRQLALGRDGVLRRAAAPRAARPSSPPQPDAQPDAQLAPQPNPQSAAQSPDPAGAGSPDELTEPHPAVRVDDADRVAP